MKINDFYQKNREMIVTGLILVGPIILLILAFFIFKVADINIKEDRIEKFHVEDQTKLKNKFDEIEIGAKAAIVKELDTGKILYAKKKDESLPLASLTKMMTALTAVQIMKENDHVIVHRENIEKEGDHGFHIGEMFKLKNILDLTLVSSSNDGASAVASAIGSVIDRDKTFIDYMNDNSAMIGMTGTKFYNETGLDLDNNTPGAKGTPDDIAKLMTYILENYPDLLDATMEKELNTQSLDGFMYHVDNTNYVVDKLPNAVLSKTGYTHLAGGNLAVVINPGLNNPIAIVVLGSTIDGRFEDVKKLSEATLHYYINE